MNERFIERIETKFIGNVYRFVFGRMPKFYRKFCSDYFRYADIQISPEIYFGFLIIYGIIIGIITFVFLNLTKLTSINKIIIPFGVFVFFEITFHYSIVMIADKRSKTAEEVLPDALKLMSSNIRSGLTTDKALMLSARPEFGPLEVQIRKAAKKSLSGVSIQESLEVISENINSNVLRKTVDLIKESISKGGNLSSLLDGIADDISRVRLLKKEIRAQVMMYSIFIFFASAIAAPILYSISSHLVGMMGNISENIGEVPSYGSFIKIDISKSNIGKNFLIKYSLISLAVTSIFSAMLIGVLSGGNEKDGIKYIPLILIISIVLYFISTIIVGKLLGLAFV
ncbi:MAG: type II secretion system F family protein [Candidatus Aenigmatarchaeota archaeon]